MKNNIRYMAGLLACGVIAAALSSCGGGGSSPQVQTLQGGPLGGVLVDSINRITIQSPPGVTSQDFQISIGALPDNFETIELLDGRTIPSSGWAFEIDVDLAGGLDLAVRVTIPYDVQKAPDPLRVGVVFLDKSSGKWVSVDVANVDPIDQSITFLTSHFSTWMPVYYPDFPVAEMSIDTRFRPEFDGFPFGNSFPSPYNVIPRFGFDIRGNCTGMSMLAVSLYKQRLPNVGGGLYSYTVREPDYRDASYFPIYQGINTASRAGNGLLQSISTFGNSLFTSIDSNDSFSKIYRALQSERSPILITISRRGDTPIIDFGDDRHMVVVYRYVRNSDGSGRFYYYDPNFPFRSNDLDLTWEKSFDHRADGSVVSFDYSPNSTPVMVESLYVSSGSSSALTPEDARNILSRNFSPASMPAPICLASVPPSGTLPFLSAVCVDDGSCPTGQVLQLIGGNNAAIPPIPRASSCVPRNTPLALTACLNAVPPDGSIPYLASICVDDGSCPSSQVLQLIGGNNAAVPPIPRLSSCVPR